MTKRTKVRVAFDYYPDDPEHGPMGMSESEYDALMDSLLGLGADNIEIERED